MAAFISGRIDDCWRERSWFSVEISAAVSASVGGFECVGGCDCGESFANAKEVVSAAYSGGSNCVVV